MVKHINELLKENERLKEENAALQQQLEEAADSATAMQTGRIDALVIADKKKLKVLTETSADKTYRVLIEKMHEGAVMLNKEGTILYCNSYFANMVNLPLQKVTGTKFENFTDELSAGKIKNFFKQGSNNTAKQEVYIYTNEGNGVPVLMSLNTLLLNSNIVVSIILTDLSIQNKNGEELKLRTKQLEDKNVELEKANKELLFQSTEKEKRSAELVLANKELSFQNEEKEKRATELMMANKELEAFTYISSHDLQEPLRKIQTFANLLLKKEYTNLSDSGKSYFHRMRDAAKRMQTLIEDLLTYSHTNAAERKFEKTDLNHIVLALKKELKDSIEEKGATIESPELSEATIIPFQMLQLFSNLVCNSLKFSKPGIPPRIIIHSSIIKYKGANDQNLLPAKDYCHISFSDNGIGFEPKFRDKIFEVFQRLHGIEKYPGTGIGLAIVKKIVDNHNGFITATGELNKGARFDIYLPVDQSGVADAT